MLSHGLYWSVVFGDNLLRLKAGMCPYISEQIGNIVSANGGCAWNDGGGDQIFTEFKGKLDITTGKYVGESQTITGGTGKFTGIQGDIPHECEGVDSTAPGTQGTCVQHFSYRLP